MSLSSNSGRGSFNAAPRSAEVWDGSHIPHSSRVLGATGNNLNSSNLDYMAEEFDEYLALQMSNVPVDFVSEDGLTDGTLNKYKVLYITEPDIPAKGQQAIAQWVENGGTLAMVPGAGQGDRYDEPANILASLAGCTPVERTYIPNALVLNETGMIGNAPVFGKRAGQPSKGRTVTFFTDNVPAVMQSRAGKGKIIYFSFYPGLSYGRLAIGPHLNLQISSQEDFLRNLVLTPVRIAEVRPPVEVNASYVETPMLVSSTGAAITLLNWTGADLRSIQVTAHPAFKIRKVESVTRGTIPFHTQGDLVSFSLPLGAADIIKLEP
ncbi:MAG TPA: hypothetical protein VFC10_15755 [Terriglobia bacterium]|nr:hypothetical protein [Terriglobia bacterium]